MTQKAGDALQTTAISDEMAWKAAAEIVESRQSSHDPELLAAARVLLTKVRALTHRKQRIVTVGDVTLPVVGWAKRTGVDTKTIYARLQQGWSEVDAVTMPSQTSGSKFGGKTLQQHSAESGIAMSCIYARLERGWSLERAITQPTNRKTDGV